ncbi:MAG: ATP-binding protein [Solirubrobacteraceae bacterium]
MIAGVRARLTPTTWSRAPRPTARLRLTLLYGGLLLVSGAVLLAVAYVLAARATDITVPGPKGAAAFGDLPSKPNIAPPTPATANHAVHLTASEATQLQAQVAHLHDLAMHRLLIGSAATLAAIAVISVALGWLMAGGVLRPVRTINAAARQISASNLHERLSLERPDDEFRELAATLNELLQRLQASFDSQRRFIANASHELRTPLTLDRALLERALRKPDPTDASWRTTCQLLLASNQQQNRLIEALLTLARSNTAADHRERLDLGALVDTVLLSPELDISNTSPQIQTQIKPAPVTGDRRLLERLIYNLIDNAIRHNVPNGHIQVATGRRDRHALLTVTNSGPSVPTGELERLLQPFQRAGTDRTTHGERLGLGLSIVHAIALAHKADLTLQPRPAGGLRIEVSFPAPASQNQQSPQTPPTTPPSAIARNQPGQPANHPPTAPADPHHLSPARSQTSGQS